MYYLRAKEISRVISIVFNILSSTHMKVHFFKMTALFTQHLFTFDPKRMNIYAMIYYILTGSSADTEV